jgi:hypothetical protein
MNQQTVRVQVTWISVFSVGSCCFVLAVCAFTAQRGHVHGYRCCRLCAVEVSAIGGLDRLCTVLLAAHLVAASFY